MHEQVLYIGGAARSGSTVLGRILASQEGVVWAGELVWLPRDLIEDRVCACGLRASKCPFWSEVRACLGWDEDALRLHHRAIWRGRHWGWLIGSGGPKGVYEAVAQVAGAKTVVDTSKYAARARWASRSSDARLVWLRQAPNTLLARLMRPRPAGRSFGLLGAAVYTLWVDHCWARLTKMFPVVEVATQDLFCEPEAVVEQLVGSSLTGHWSKDRPLPSSHALTGHAGAMCDLEWSVSAPPELGPWARRIANGMSRARGGLI